MIQESIHGLKKAAMGSLFTVLALSAVPASVNAAEPDNGIESDNGWKFNTAAYLWMASINGNQTVKGNEAELT